MCTRVAGTARLATDVLSLPASDQPPLTLPAPGFRTIQVHAKDIRGPCGHSRCRQSGDPPAAPRQNGVEIMMRPHLPGPRPVAVPGIGFPQSIPIGPEVAGPGAFGDLWDDHRDASRLPRLASITTALDRSPIVRWLLS
jgi:hypothetical protein